MNRWQQYVLKESRKVGKFQLVLGLVGSIFLVTILSWSWGAKNNPQWLVESDLSIATGQVEWTRNEGDSTYFKLNGSSFIFSYEPLYGRMTEAIRGALDQSMALISVGFELKSGKNEFGIERKYQTVLKLDLNSKSILSYEQSRRTFEDDAHLLPWLIVLGVIGVIFCFYGLLLINKHGMGRNVD